MATVLAAGWAATAEATTPRAASGERCTIVGTSRADVLKGTAGRDVICGLGGDDVLRGLGGNDVLDEGPGRGRVYGGDGDDKLYGGRDGDRMAGGGGVDRLSGGAGVDALDGGTGDDRLAGGDGGDELDGGWGNDRVAGDGGSDRLAGGEGRDALAGGTGNDVEDGGAGADTVTGGTGRDTVAGGAGNDLLLGNEDSDRLLGGDGNDDLDGGGSPDNLDGGAGTNWCIVGAEDTQKACVYDKSAPRVLSIQAIPGAVDVTNSSRDVVLRAHIVDDTGVDWAFLSVDHAGTDTDNRLVSGTVRDGWWETTVRVRRYSPAGSYPAHVQVKDRVGRLFSERFEDVLDVADRTPDTEAPVISDLRISPAQIDIRTAGATVTVTARITDNVAGVAPSNVISNSVVFRSPDANGVYSEDPVVGGGWSRVSGTAHDGRYRAVMEIPKGGPGGTWSIQTQISDIAANSEPYLGEDLWRYMNGDAPMPGAERTRLPGGRLLVTGTAVDSSPPKLLEARIDTPSVDTLPGPATVTVDLHLRDSGDGVMEILPTIIAGEIQIFGQPEAISGTIFDGWWRVTFRLPQGLPPGSYTPNFTVRDRRNGVGYVGPAAGGTVGAFRTTGGADWDGTITVIANPSSPPQQAS